MYLVQVAVTASIYLKINTFSARKNLKQQYLKVVKFSDPSLSKKYIYAYEYAA